MADPLLQLRGVTKSFPVGDSTVSVLRNASLALATGSSTAIVGPSGSGKSTVLNLIGTLDRPDSGEILFEGADLTRLNPAELARFRNRKIGFIFQAHHLLPHCTVLENVLVPALAFQDRAPDEVVQRARQLLDRVGLGARLDHLPGRLSGGERQRAAVVRALVNAPSLLLADEPTGALDRVSAGEIGTLLVELNREQKVTLLVVTHSQELAARMERTLEMRDGALVAA
jgi:lipoprotein-releasing system ATP-binding protein